jgi:hypothetical protein
MRQKEPAAVRHARIQLRQAIDEACIARGEAEWTNGYRTALIKTDPSKAEELRVAELRRFAYCAKAEATVERLMRVYAKALRKGT